MSTYRFSLLTLVCLILILTVPAVADTTDDDAYRWALGWAGSIELRRQASPDWEFSLSAAPYETRHEEQRWEWDDSDPPEDQGVEQVPYDSKTENGWVRLRAGRRLFDDGPVRLTVTTSLRYGWAHTERNSHRIYQPGTNESTTEYAKDETTWSLAMGFRISVEVTERLWLETGMGLIHGWSDWTEVETSRRLEGSEPTLVTERTENKGNSDSFDDFGWSGLSSLSFVVWF